MFFKLPDQIKALGVRTYAQFLLDPNHPLLCHHALDDIAKGRHRHGSFSVRITQKYRAIYVVDGDTKVCGPAP